MRFKKAVEMTVQKPIPESLLRPITKGENRAMNQLEFLAITCNSFKSRVQGVIGFCFPSNAIAFNLFRQSFENCSIKQSNLV